MPTRKGRDAAQMAADRAIGSNAPALEARGRALLMEVGPRPSISVEMNFQTIFAASPHWRSKEAVPSPPRVPSSALCREFSVKACPRRRPAAPVAGLWHSHQGQQATLLAQLSSASQ